VGTNKVQCPNINFIPIRSLDEMMTCPLNGKTIERNLSLLHEENNGEQKYLCRLVEFFISTLGIMLVTFTIN